MLFRHFFLPVAQSFDPASSIKAGALLAIIRQTRRSISSDETRANINSAMFELDGSVARMVTTDGHRLSVGEIAASTPTIPGVLLSAATIDAVCGLCSEADEHEEVSIQIRGQVAQFSAGQVRLTAKLIEAQFPPWAQVVPQVSTRTAKVDKSALIEAVRALSVVSDPVRKVVKLTFQTGKLSITSESSTTGTGQDEIYCSFDGLPITIGANPLFIIDAVEAVDSSDVFIKMDSELDPILIQSPSSDNGKWVIMPCRV